MYGSHDTTPSICEGDCTDSRGHVCYRDADAAWLAENPWEA